MFDIFVNLPDVSTTYNHAKAGLMSVLYFSKYIKNPVGRLMLIMLIYVRLHQVVGLPISKVFQTTTDSKLHMQGHKNEALMMKDIIEVGHNNELLPAQNIEMKKDLTAVRQDFKKIHRKSEQS